MKLYTLGTSHGAAEPGRMCSAHLIECGGRFYLFDCGGSVESSLVDMDIPVTAIEAIFISHIHEDHVGGITGVLKHFYGYNPEKYTCPAYLPGEYFASALRSWISVLEPFRYDPVEQRLMIEYYDCAPIFSYEDGFVFDDGNIRISAISTDHLAWYQTPSYAFLIEGEGKRMLYTSDLASDFHDYPEIALTEELDLVLCELVHFDLATNFEAIAQTKTKHLVFTHYRENKLNGQDGYQFPFPVDLATDGDVFEI
jgi:ribonuclease BN (tRNA processing enzyme)